MTESFGRALVFAAILFAVLYFGYSLKWVADRLRRWLSTRKRIKEIAKAWEEKNRRRRQWLDDKKYLRSWPAHSKAVDARREREKQ